jgi:hypothetical protein
MYVVPDGAVLGDELCALRRVQREQGPKSPFAFTSERGAPFSTAGFARMVERAGGRPSWPSRENEKRGYDKMQSDFSLPADIANNAKDRCEKVFNSFQLQAVCMENEQNGYEKMRRY